MMSFGDAQCIHISGTTKDLLPATYVTKERGKINVKGKGEMVTFWMESKSGRAPPPKDEVCIILQRKRTNFHRERRQRRKLTPTVRTATFSKESAIK